MHDLKRLLRLSRGYRLWMAGGIALSVTVILANVALLSLSGWFIASMALAGLGLIKMEFFTAAALIRGLAILRTIARYLERLVTHEATLRLLARLRVWFFERLAPRAPAGLEGLRDGDLLARLQADIDSLDNFYLRLVVPVAAGGIAGLVVVAGLGVVDLRVALVMAAALVMAGVMVPLLALLAGRRAGAELVEVRADLGAAATDLTRGLMELQIAGAAERQAGRIGLLGRALIARQRRAAWIAAAGTALSGLMGQLAMWATLLILVPRVSAGTLSGPDLSMMVLGVLAGTEAVGALPAAFAAWGTTAAAARRIFALAEAGPTATPVAAVGALRVPERCDIAFAQVAMGYGGGDAVLSGFDLDVPQGQILALTGPSGAGKTTVLELLQGFWPPVSGSIRIGGVPVSAIPEAELRRLITVVGQHSHVFDGTVRDAMLLADPGAGEDRIWAALAALRLEDDIRALPQGLDTPLGEGASRLSGGQVRRIAVARAFLRTAPILLLDEPTEGLDAKSETAVIEALDRLLAGRTAIIVSHRPRLLRLATLRRQLEAPARG